MTAGKAMISLLSIKAEMARKDELEYVHKPIRNSHPMLHERRVKHAFLQCTENTPRFRGIGRWREKNRAQTVR